MFRVAIWVRGVAAKARQSHKTRQLQKIQRQKEVAEVPCHVTARPSELERTRTEHQEPSLPLSLHLMATHIVSWGGGKEHITPPVFSSTKPSIVSIDSMLPHRRETSLIVPETLRAAGSYAKHMSPLMIEPSRSEASTSASTYPRVDAGDDSFIRHHKYFFEDGNVTFLVR